MGLLAESIDKKFGEAEQLFLAGKDPIIMDESLMKMRFEIIGLDSEIGGRARYLLTRYSIDTAGLTFADGVLGNEGELDVTNYLVRIPREKGDHRAFEDLPTEAFVGELLHVDTTRDKVAKLLIAAPQFMGEAAVRALAVELATLRVVERLPKLPSLT